MLHSKRPNAERAVLARIGWKNKRQLRALVCEGDQLLAWVGGTAESFGTREPALLAALLPAFQRRIALAQRVAEGARRPAMEAILEALGRAVFVVDTRTGRITDANAPARAMLATDRACVEEAIVLARATSTLPPGWSMLRARARARPHELVVTVAVPRECLPTSVDRATARWQLTPRQKAVLTELAAGNANRNIAARLGISVRTVEIHVTALLEKAQVENRTELIAKLHAL